jgi:hypothetical protein
MVLTACFVISSVSRAFLPPSQVTMRSIVDRLDISVGISGPHDFAVRRKPCSSGRARRPPHPAPNVRDDRETPLSRSTGCESGYSCFYPAVKVNSENPKLIGGKQTPALPDRLAHCKGSVAPLPAMFGSSRRGL